MPIKPHQVRMLATGKFNLTPYERHDRLSTPERAQRIGRLFTNIVNRAFAGTEIDLTGLGLHADLLQILDFVLEANIDVAARIKCLRLDVFEWFPFRMPQFKALVNLETLHIGGDRCGAFFNGPLNFPQLREFTWNEPRTNIEAFPDLRACSKLQIISVSCFDVRYPSEFSVPGLADAREIGFDSFKTIFPELQHFSFNTTTNQWNRYANQQNYPATAEYRL